MICRPVGLSHRAPSGTAAGRSGTAAKISGGLGKPFRSGSLLLEGNACGTPALTLPIGLDKEGLPTALQIDGRTGP